MKPVTASEAFESLASYASNSKDKFKEELLAFTSSPHQACELLTFSYDPKSAVTRYCKVRTRLRLPIKIIRKGEKVLGIKEGAYVTLLEELKAGRYADRIINQVAEEEARRQFFSEWDV